MKPTQQEIIDVAREAGIVFDERAMPYYERLVHLALERFGAGGGEPVAYMCPTSRAMAGWSMEDGPDYLEWADEASDYEKRVGKPLYTHPSPTDLRAEYLRGLEDAWKVCDERANGVNDAQECADAIEALKGKQ